MAFPYLDNPPTIDEMTLQELDALVVKLNTFLGQQHTDAGGHGDITATSVDVKGPVIVRDELGFPSTFARNVKQGTRIDVKTNPKEHNGNPSFLLRLGLKPSPTDEAEFGNFGSGGAGLFFGLRLGPNAVMEWRMLAGVVAGADAWMLVDGTHLKRTLLVVRDTATGDYRVRPEAIGFSVHLGQAPPERRFATGWINDVHSLNTFERGRAASVGDWTNVPYAAGDFLAVGAGNTWGVDSIDLLVHHFALIGQTLHYHVSIFSSDMSGAPVELTIALPAGYTTSHYFHAPCLLSDAGATKTTGVVYSTPGDTVLRVQKLDGSPWTATASDNTAVYITATVEVTG